LYAGRQFDEAIAHLKNALEMHRNYRLLHGYMTMAYVGKGMYAEAVAEMQKGLALSGAGPSERAILAHIYGRMAEFRRLERCCPTSCPAETRRRITSPSRMWAWARTTMRSTGWIRLFRNARGRSMN
jgi:tetratricopeptide (TPR) repeat protein